MKKIFIIVLAVLTVPYVMGQKLTDIDHLKYWYYRQRLLDEFVIVGEAENLGEPSGLSLPAISAINWTPNHDILDMSWIENPAQHLGWYIGVLASELKLLYLSGEPYEETKQELYYAMKAYERLDYHCEYFVDPGGETYGEVNGFFMRDDVPGDFLTRDENLAFKEKNPKYSTTIHSTYKRWVIERDYYQNNILNSGEEWQGLLTGFAIIVHALAECPREVVIYNIPEGGYYNFNREAIRHTQNYMDRLKNDYWEGRLESNPDTIYRYGADGKLYQVLYGLASAADYICDPERNYKVPIVFPERDYNDFFPYVDPFKDIELRQLFFSTLKDTTVKGYFALLTERALGEEFIYKYQKYSWLMFGDPASHAIWTDSIGSKVNEIFRDEQEIELCWPLIVPPYEECHIFDSAAHRHVATTSYALAAIGNSWERYDEEDEEWTNITFGALRTYTQPVEWQYFPLLNMYLHPGIQLSAAYPLMQEMADHLKTAPSAGPHFFSLYEYEESQEVEGWRGGVKWYCSPEAAKFGDPKRDANARYNGLDFMLAYNLLWLECMQRGSADDFFQLDYFRNDRDAAYSFYRGSHANVFYTYGELNLNSSTNINSSRDVILYGREVYLEGPFEIESGKEATVITKSKVTLPDIEEVGDS